MQIVLLTTPKSSSAPGLFPPDMIAPMTAAALHPWFVENQFTRAPAGRLRRKDGSKSAVRAPGA
jgi:hypothetical protein